MCRIMAIKFSQPYEDSKSRVTVQVVGSSDVADILGFFDVPATRYSNTRNVAAGTNACRL